MTKAKLILIIAFVVTLAAGAVANIPGGMVVDAVGRRGLLMGVALSWIGLPYLVMGFSHHYWMLLVCAAWLWRASAPQEPAVMPSWEEVPVTYQLDASTGNDPGAHVAQIILAGL